MALSALAAKTFGAKTFAPTTLHGLEVIVVVAIPPQPIWGGNGGGVRVGVRRLKVKAKDFDRDKIIEQTVRENEELIMMILTAIEVIEDGIT